MTIGMYINIASIFVNIFMYTYIVHTLQWTIRAACKYSSTHCAHLRQSRDITVDRFISSCQPDTRFPVQRPSVEINIIIIISIVIIIASLSPRNHHRHQQ